MITLCMEGRLLFEIHVDADEIYRQARQKSPNTSLSTVYRGLQFFKYLGLVEEQARILERERENIRKRLEELKK